MSVKDFKAVVTHAETLRASIKATYSFPSRPLQLAYDGNGLKCEFTLATIGEYRGVSASPAPSTSRAQASAPRQSERASAQSGQQTLPAIGAETRSPSDQMPPPIQPASRSFLRESASQRPSRPEVRPPKASITHESLFVSNDDEETQWEEKNYDLDEDQLGWDTGAQTVRVDHTGTEYGC
jgi:cell cycle checkpoint control protein RAD9A